MLSLSNDSLLKKWNSFGSLHSFIVFVFVAMQSTEKSLLCKVPKSDRTLQKKCNLYWVCRLSQALRIFPVLSPWSSIKITNPNLLRQVHGLWISFFSGRKFYPWKQKKPANICQESCGNPTHPREMSPKLGSMNQGKQKTTDNSVVISRVITSISYHL